MSAFRHELKYLIPYSLKDELIRRFAHSGLLQADAHAKDGCYSIRSLYFDDPDHSAYEEKLMGIASRHKWRIRFYDGDDSFLRLEKKIKQGSYIRKESAPLSRAEANAVLSGSYSFLLQRDEPLCREFYIACTSFLLRPAVIVDYEREPYVLDAGTVRLTFDEQIRAAICGTDPFEASLPSLPVLEEGVLIMEVKYTAFLPELVQNLLSAGQAQQTQASKYAMCIEAMRFVH